MDLNELTKEQKKELASDKNTPPETLNLLAKDEYPSVREYVAENPNTPECVKEYLTARKFMENL